MNDDIQLGVPQALAPTGQPKEVEFAALKLKVPGIMKKRMFITSGFFVLSIGVLVLIFFFVQAGMVTVPDFLGFAWCGVICLCVLGFIIELVNMKKPYQWYQSINFFFWNLLTQISLYASRSQASTSRRRSVESLVTFHPIDAMSNAFRAQRAEDQIKYQVESYHDTQIIDRYLELSSQLSYGAQQPLDK